MKSFVVFVCLVFLSHFSFTQEDNIFSFSLLRQNDKILIKESNSFYDNLKSFKLSENSILNFGGSYRFQTEAFINEQFNATIEKETDAWYLHRLMLHGHLKIGNQLELFGELNSSLIHSKENIIPVDKDELSVNQLFVKYHINKNWSVLVGRQNIRLGSGRLIDVREGPNVRLSFDMIQLSFVDENTKIQSFYSIPVKQVSGVFDNTSLESNESLSALYWTQNWSNKTSTDFYFLYKKEENKIWSSGFGDDERFSLGLRHFGNWNGFTYNNEFVYQFGKFENQNISAWTASFNIERQFLFGDIGVKTELISGDGKNRALNTFDGLYPRGAYFGRVARFGPSNLIDFHPYYNTKIGKFNLEFDYVAFWRYSTFDGIYGPSLMLDYPSINNKSFIGHQFGGIVSYEINNFLSVELESNIIIPGAFLQESNLNDNLYHFVLTTELKF
jgi:hypothetical protein